MNAKTPTPPVAEQRPETTTLHGRGRVDDYAWLRDADWQQVMKTPEVLDKDIRAYLEAENAYTETVLAPEAALRDALYGELKARIKEDDSSVPADDGDFAYYRRYETGGQHPVFCRRKRGGTGDEEILLHGDREAEGRAYYRLGACRQSPDHRLLAHSADVKGSEYFTLRIRDLATGEDLPDRIETVQPGVVWANDGRTIFYTVLDENHRPTKVYRHAVGDDPADDILVYEESDPGFFMGVDLTESRRFAVIDCHDHTTGESRLIDAHDPGAKPRLIAARETDVEYDVTHHGDRLLIRTNADGAEDYKIVEAPLDAPGRENWRDVVPHRPGVLIRGFTVFEGHMARLERVEGLPRIVITDLAGGVEQLASGIEHDIAFDEEAYDLGLSSGYEFATTTLRFRYSSMTTPERVYDYDMATRERVLRKEQEIPSGHDAAQYITRRLMAPAPDGETVPVSLVYHKDTKLDGTAPLLLYGYGSYGMSMPANFGANRFSLIDRGFVYAIAHIRGGMDKGYRWYKDGKLGAKTNTFTDFIAAAEHLVGEGYTAAGSIVAHGGSAGGMLMGAVANMRPDLFRGLVAEVPFVDVLTTMCDANLPLTPPEWPEWGNPLEDEAAYETILSYSPYDNVGEREYPHILATAGLTDPRVTYWEPAKWVAKLRALKTDENLTLLRTNMNAGHGGAAGRFDRLEEIALVYAFVLRVSEKA